MEVEEQESETKIPQKEDQEQSTTATKEEEEEDVPTKQESKKCCLISSCITKDKIERIIYAWLFSLHIAIFLNWLGICGCWKLIFVTLGLGATITILTFATFKVSPDGRVVLITGCDSGFGHALSLKLDSLGFTVIACCLSTSSDGATQLKEEGSERLHVLQMNVCNETEISQARKAVDKIVSEEGLWGVINNAGISTFGELEWVPLSTYRKITEVNLLGIVSVTKAFLPLVRKAKGRVINVSSMLGRMGGAMRSPYTMTKFGVEGLSECLRQEMKPWGVDVILMEPGNFISGTSLFSEESVNKMSEEMWSAMSQEVKDDYTEEYYKSKIDVMKSYTSSGITDISPVITSFVESLTQQYPQARYQPMEWAHRIRILISSHCPEWLYDYIYVGAMNK